MRTLFLVVLGLIQGSIPKEIIVLNDEDQVKTER